MLDIEATHAGKTVKDTGQMNAPDNLQNNVSQN